MSEDWKNDRAEASMHEFEMKNMAKAAAEYQKTHPKMTIKQILDEIASCPIVHGCEISAGMTMTRRFCRHQSL